MYVIKPEKRDSANIEKTFSQKPKVKISTWLLFVVSPNIGNSTWTWILLASIFGYRVQYTLAGFIRDFIYEVTQIYMDSVKHFYWPTYGPASNAQMS